jgi:hypothetical protein
VSIRIENPVRLPTGQERGECESCHFLLESFGADIGIASKGTGFWGGPDVNFFQKLNEQTQNIGTLCYRLIFLISFNFLLKLKGAQNTCFPYFLPAIQFPEKIELGPFALSSTL